MQPIKLAGSAVSAVPAIICCDIKTNTLIQKWITPIGPHPEATRNICPRLVQGHTCTDKRARSHAMMELTKLAYDLLFNPRHTKWMGPLFVLGDTFLCALVIWKVPCEISRILPLRTTTLTIWTHYRY